jgi:hypothetical protein
MGNTNKPVAGNRSQSAIQRRKNAYTKQMRAAASLDELRRIGPPEVVGPPLSDPEYLTFAKFLQLEQTRQLFGIGGDAAGLLVKLTSDQEFLLARANARSQKAERTRWRKLFADYVRRAYCGDKRGLLYWRRVSKVIWVAYENMLRLKVWAARTRKGEWGRVERWQARAEKERVRQRDRRAKAKSLRGSRAAKKAARSSNQRHAQNGI